MYRFKSIKYLSATGIITALLFVVGYLSSIFFAWAISIFGGTTTLQLFDALFIPFCAIFKGPMMLFSGSIAGTFLDLASGVKIVTIPMTILIRVLMFFIIKILINHKWWSSFYSFFAASIVLIFGYPLSYVIIYHDKAIVITELIIDTIQAAVAYFVAIPLYYYLYQLQVKSKNHLWNDRQFDGLKLKKEDIGEENGNW